MANIIANLDKMFSKIEPWDVSNSVANLGECAGTLTWNNALKIAAKHSEWLESPLAEAVNGMIEWALATGAWDELELENWTEQECLALFVQNIASELREFLDADNAMDMKECVDSYREHSDDGFGGVGHYFRRGNTNKVEYYTGC